MRIMTYAVGILLALMITTGFSEEAEADTLLASWYGPGFGGNLTCSGEVFDPYGFTAASLIYPQGTVLLVSYGGNSAYVRVNDCGPYVGGRQIDLSQGAAEYLGLTYAGVDYVEAYPVP